MMSNSSSPGPIRKSDSSQSVNRGMWDSSDPSRNPAPLPLPDNHAPMSAIRTQSKVSAVHRKLGSSASTRSLSLAVQDPEPPVSSLYELVTMIHTNLETLLKRSQNNARDLGKLRGDVRNPHAIEEIKKILQESSSVHANGELHDPDTQRRIDSEMAAKLDALLKMSTAPSERPITAASITSAESLASSQALKETNERLLEMLGAIRRKVDQHLPVVLPDPVPIMPPELPKQIAPQAVQVTIDTSALEATVADLSGQIGDKLAELQNIDARLCARKLELASLESRSASLQENLSKLMSMMTETREAEQRRLEELEEQRATRKEEATLRKKKSSLGRRALQPLAPSADRRIVSLSNVDSSPLRKVRQTTKPSSPTSVAPPLKSESPFARNSFVLPNSVNPTGGEVRLSPHRMQSTLRSTPPRKASWSRRVSQIFTSGNKENGFANHILADRGHSGAPRSAGWSENTDSLGRGLASGGNLRASVRSFSYRG